MRLADHRNIVVLTGAGISQSAGLPIYRGAGGLWSDPELAALSDVRALVDRRAEACDLFWRFRGQIPLEAERTAKHALRDCDLFVAIGTSGTVAPASSFVRWAQLNGARSLLLNLELFEGARELYGEHDTGPADELVPRWFAPPAGTEEEAR